MRGADIFARSRSWDCKVGRIHIFQIGTLLQALLQRGLDDGTFRSDVTAGELQFLLGHLLKAAARMTAAHQAASRKPCRGADSSRDRYPRWRFMLCRSGAA